MAGEPVQCKHWSFILFIALHIAMVVVASPVEARRSNKGPLDPSFKCAGARGRVDRFICGSLFLNLGPLDVTMQTEYRVALRHAEARTKLISDQRRWLISRGVKCPIPHRKRPALWRDDQTTTCLRGLYDLRIAALRVDARHNDPFAHLELAREGAAGEHADQNATLADASYVGDLLTLNRLLAGGAKLDVTGALYGAAWRGSIPIVRRLIAAGGDPNGRIPIDGKSISTPLFVALELDHRETAAFLLDHGGSIFSVSNNTCLLSHAVMTGRMDLVRKVLATHPSVDARAIDVNGGRLDTALTIAIKRGYRDISKALLDAGADPNLAGPEGAPLKLAETLSGDPQIARLLRTHGTHETADH